MRPASFSWTPGVARHIGNCFRALRLISEGALDESSVEDLASRVGVGARQLRAFLSNI